MATELGPTPVKKPASGGTELHHAPKGVGEDNVIASQGKWASWLLAPTIVALSIVIVYPIISAIVMSFQADAGLDPATGLFTEGGPAGFSNYINWLAQQCAAPDGGTVSCPPGTLGSQFWSATATTFFFTVVTVALETVLGFWMAMIMAREFRGRSLVRAAVLVPWAIPTAVTAKLWFFIFAFEGIANKLFNTTILWTGSEWPAKWAVVIADVWKTTPFMALLILAGLQMIPAEVYEAAKVDGATAWQRFRLITLPLVKPALMVAILFRTLDALRMFDLPYILTGGGNNRRLGAAGPAGQRPEGSPEPGKVGPRAHVHQCLGDPALVPGPGLLDGGDGVPRGRLHLRHLDPADPHHAGQLQDGVRHLLRQPLRPGTAEQLVHRHRRHPGVPGDRRVCRLRTGPLELQVQVPCAGLHPGRFHVPRRRPHHPAVPALHEHRLDGHLPGPDHPEHLVRAAADGLHHDVLLPGDAVGARGIGPGGRLHAGTGLPEGHHAAGRPGHLHDRHPGLHLLVE